MKCLYKRICKIAIMLYFQIKKSAKISTLEVSCLSFPDYIVPPMLIGYHYLDFLLITILFIVLSLTHLSLNNILFGFLIRAWVFFHDLILLVNIVCFRLIHYLYSASGHLHGCDCVCLVFILFGQFLCCAVIKYFGNPP